VTKRRGARSGLSCLVWSLLLLNLSCSEPNSADHQGGKGDTGVTEEGEDQLSQSPLVSGSAWRLTSPERDPFVGRATGRISCGGADFGIEYGGLEVSTAYCGYITLTQPLLNAVKRGDVIELSAWHSPLVSASPGEGLIALQLAGQTVWQQELSIPAEAKSWEARFESPVSAEAGEPVLFHVSNHGANSYTLYSLTVTQP